MPKLLGLVTTCYRRDPHSPLVNLLTELPLIFKEILFHAKCHSPSVAIATGIQFPREP